MRGGRTFPDRRPPTSRPGTACRPHGWRHLRVEGDGPPDHPDRSPHGTPDVADGVSPSTNSPPPRGTPPGAIEHPRSIRSFVTRGGRITDAQQRALDLLWPRYGIDFAPVALDFEMAFGRQAPVTLEIGFGNGENLTALAVAHPERNYLGVEVHRPGVGRLLLGVEARRLSNIRSICHDAV